MKTTANNSYFNLIQCLPAVLLILLIRTWQLSVSPFIGNHCRFHPSCSQYSLEALKNYGFFRGSFLMLKRLLRCNSLCKGGLDPIP